MGSLEDTERSTSSETGQFMSSTYYVRVRNQASTCLTDESVHREPRKADLSTFLAFLKVVFNLGKSITTTASAFNLGDQKLIVFSC